MSIGCIFTVETFHETPLQKRIDIQHIPLQYTHSVGFGIAYPRKMGDARALYAG